VFAGFLIDSSGSMQPYQKDVIDGHRLMLDTLRQAEDCHKKVLYVHQSLFADQPIPLNGFYPLDVAGNDEVVVLNDKNYKPNGNTAMFDAIISMAKDLESHLEVTFKQGFNPAARIAVITDGRENKSRSTQAEVQAVIERLRGREWLESSVVVGLKNADFDEAKLEDLRVAIGFSQKIGLDRNPREIRRAFVLASRVGAGTAT